MSTIIILTVTPHIYVGQMWEVQRMRYEIDTVAKRARLKPRKNPYWQGLAGGRGGLTLGYRKRARGAGAWIAKIVVCSERIEERLGVADDIDAPLGSISYRDATAATLEWSTRQQSILSRSSELARRGAAPTVRTAVEEYLAALARRSKQSRAGAKSRLGLHVLSDTEFAALRLSALRATAIEEWLGRLVYADVTRLAKSPGASSLAASSINRILNDLRAALNAAATRRRRELPAHIFQEIKLGTKAVEGANQARRQLLSDDQIRAVIQAAYEVDDAGDFGRLVALVAATGARYSQVAALNVVDLQVDLGRVMIPGSQKGRIRVVKPPVPIPLAPDVLALLKPVTWGRDDGAPLLERWTMRQTGKAKWTPDHRRRWGAAYDTQRRWAAAVVRAGLPSDTVMYALRHSSIVRGLRKMLPVRLVAALHDTSVEMIEQHYAAFIVDVTEDLARRAALSMSSNGRLLERLAARSNT